MIPLEEAQEFVLSGCPRGEETTVPVDEARLLVTSTGLHAAGAIPPFDNTAMDGFAVRSADVADAPTTLRIVDTLAAGAAPSRAVEAGEAIRIMTGAPIPPGADSVVMVELTETAGDDVTVVQSVPEGNHIRPAGDDVREGDLVFEAGTVLDAAHLGVCTSIGVYDVPVYRRPRVGVISTGDELVDAPVPLEMGQIRDSNRHTLLALVAAMGADAVDLGLIADDEALIRDAMIQGAQSCDAVITSGGVSMGDFDFVKKVLDEIGDMRWMQVAIKPAKPLAFGTIDGTPVFGLPGNPVSSMVSFELFARPGLRKMMGYPNPHNRTLTAVAGANLPRRADGKIHFARVVAEAGTDGRYRVQFAGGQGSHQLSAMASANALAIVPDGDGISIGEDVQVLFTR
ncbi:MAG: molybdopterin molybdenumtransferase MoeA [Acidimicrobiales bacterium]|nr:MAG: molybdopterin molybdenumtransferase MoeA [Acidimicrobiales bacterium]